MANREQFGGIKPDSEIEKSPEHTEVYSPEKSHEYWIDTAQTLVRNLEDAKVGDPEFDYRAALKAYEDVIDEVKVRKNNYAESPMIDAQAGELIEEFEGKKKSFEEKFQ